MAPRPHPVTAVPGVVFTPAEGNAFISGVDDEFTQ